MGKNNKNEELQSRREFFKKAAKGALPILGAIVLAGAPNLIRAENEEVMGCEYCKGGCTGCQGNCYTGCKTTCKGGCQNGCQSSCIGGCKIYCTSSSKR